MKHIVLDLEFNSFPKKIMKENDKFKRCPFEIIEIGAIKLDENFNMIDTFRMYIKPTIYYCVNYLITKKTKIKIQDLREGGFPFDKVLFSFLKWLSNDYILYTWSNNDYGVMKMNCEFYNQDYSWFNNYIDIQEEYRKFKNDINIKSLYKVTNELNIPVYRPVHNALIDAQSTAEILKYINGKEIFQMNDSDIIEIPVEEAKIITCPKCKQVLPIEYEQLSITKKYNMLAKCNNCNFKIQRIIYKIPNGGNIVKIQTKLINENTYADMLKFRKKNN